MAQVQGEQTEVQRRKFASGQGRPAVPCRRRARHARPARRRAPADGPAAPAVARPARGAGGLAVPPRDPVRLLHRARPARRLCRDAAGRSGAGRDAPGAPDPETPRGTRVLGSGDVSAVRAAGRTRRREGLSEDRLALVRVRRLRRGPRADGTPDGDPAGAQAHAAGDSRLRRAARRRPRAASRRFVDGRGDRTSRARGARQRRARPRPARRVRGRFLQLAHLPRLRRLVRGPRWCR